MDTSKLVEKVEGFFDLSKKKQQKKHDKLRKIIHKLEKKQSTIEQKLHKQGQIDAGSSRYQDLQRELRVISKLISKAKHNDPGD